MDGQNGSNMNSNGQPTVSVIPVSNPVNTETNNLTTQPMNIPTGNVIPNMSNQNSNSNPILGVTEKKEVTYLDVIGNAFQQDNQTNTNSGTQTGQGFFNPPINTTLDQSSVSSTNNTQNNQPTASLENNNQFINNTGLNQNTHLNDLNVDGSYNHLEKSDFSNDPQVRQNINEHTKKTVPVSNELKLVIIIAVLMFIFILFMPEIFDLLRNIKFNISNR